MRSMAAFMKSWPMAGPGQVRTGVAMFEPHPAGHAHMRYSAPLTAALASICPERRFTLLVSPEGAPPHTTIFGVEIEGAIRTPRTLNSYTSPVAGVLDRLAHWGRADRQIGRWVSAHPDIRLVHYQDFYGLATLAGITALRRMGVRALLTVHNVRPHDIP